MLTFDPDTHTYALDGELVPSVTEICAPLGADYDEPDELAELAIDAAAERGTILHAYLAHRLGGGEADDFELPGVCQPYADAVELFLAEHTVVPYAIETPIGCDRYAGTPDLICEYDGRDAIVDWKFVSQIAKSKVAGQLGGYQRLAERNGIYLNELYAVQFTRDAYRVYPVNADFALRAFYAALDVYELKHKKHPRGRIG